MSPNRFSSTRSSARSTRARARRSRPVDAGAGDGDRRPRRGHQRGAGQPRPVRRGRLTSSSPSSAASSGGAAAGLGPGAVFEALTERDGQLRAMITTSTRSSATTAARDSELKEAFVALPTFQRESRTTLRRLDPFADNTNPLVTQLRPAARELSPTLNDLEALAPDLQGALPRPRAADHGLAEGLPGGGEDCSTTCARSCARSTRRCSS